MFTVKDISEKSPLEAGYTPKFAVISPSGEIVATEKSRRDAQDSADYLNKLK